MPASAPPPPSVDTTCDASLVQAVPASRHPGACVVLSVENFGWVNTTTIQRTYSTQGVVNERQQRWGASADGNISDYTLTILDNSWDAQGREERSIQRQWYLQSEGGGYADWSSTVFGYGTGGYSAYTWSSGRSGAPRGMPPIFTHQQDFVIDSQGTVINTRDWWPMGNDKTVAVTFHANGVVASESWDGMFCPYCHESAETDLFDDSGNRLELDTLYLRGGAGENKSKTTSTYDQGRLVGRRLDYTHYPSFDTSLLLGESIVTETYTYDGAQLKAMDSREDDATCPWTFVGQTPVSTCSWKVGPQLHTAYNYDSTGHLASRVVTDANGNELSRYTAVSDASGNLLCESQAQGGVLQSFSRYDYSCW